MKLPPEGARWLVRIRWLACAGALGTVWFCARVLGVVERPGPLYVVVGGMVAYNLLFWASQRDWPGADRDVQRNIFLQIAADMVALTLLLYFADISRNPFMFFFVFHMIIASMYLHGSLPYLLAALAAGMVGTVMALEYFGLVPRFSLRLPTDPPGGQVADGLHLLGVFVALTSTLLITVYFTTSIHRYVDRAHAELRQKEKMLGIGQLVAGIGHQIANPLDGLQNCLARVGEHLKGDPHLNEYLQMMNEALQRIERTVKRVQAFARPRGITLQPTDVNQAVEGTLAVLGRDHKNIHVETVLGEVPPVEGDPYTLQEVLFNLCTNALAAMPHGGTLTLRTYNQTSKDENRLRWVAVDVADTGVGIPRVNLEKIFEPFFTTRAEAGGTGLGLGLCRMLISEMGGQIEVRSTVGKGTTFTVLLYPARKSAASLS